MAEKNVWIYGDRIVYVGHELPDATEHIHTINCEGKYIVPGYIEPHTHPFQIYNPQTLAEYVSQFEQRRLLMITCFFFCIAVKRKRLLY